MSGSRSSLNSTFATRNMAKPSRPVSLLNRCGVSDLNAKPARHELAGITGKVPAGDTRMTLSMCSGNRRAQKQLR